jgi:hypothetical protein
VNDLSLSRNGGTIFWSGGQTLSTSDNITWTLASLQSRTEISGNYTLTLTAAGSGAFVSEGPQMAARLASLGVITVVPLLFFGTGVRPGRSNAADDSPDRM